MTFESLSLTLQIFLLAFGRIMGLILTAPLTSSSAFPGVSKAGLGLFTAILIAPYLVSVGYPVPENGLAYVFILIGEVMVGVIMGLFLNILFTVFQVAGQYFSIQMGFGASQVFDPLAQVQIPVMGQFFNLLATLIFLVSGGLKKLFLIGIEGSFETFMVTDILFARDNLFEVFSSALGGLFYQAMVLAFPILGTLMLVSISMGLLARAAPQMNLLMLGFPIAIGVAFLVLFLIVPVMVQTVEHFFDEGFVNLRSILNSGIGGSLGGNIE
jgi:flagellar biosynthetic protein FliR